MQRIRKHRECSKNPKSKSYDYPLMRAFRKYGTDNFLFKILEVCNEKENRADRELWWYNHLKPEYNQESPDEPKSANKKPVYQIDVNTLKIVSEFDSILDAARKLSVNGSSISRACSNNSRSHAHKYYWCFKDDYYDGWNPKIPIGMKIKDGILVKSARQRDNTECYSFDIDTLERKYYKSISEAAKETGVNGGSIINTCNGKAKTAGNYWWCYKDNLDNFTIDKKTPKGKVQQIDTMSLEVINTYNNITEAELSVGAGRGVIAECCYRHTTYSCGYYWRFVRDSKNWKPLMGGRKPVVFFINGEYQRIYLSMLDAQKDLGYDRKSMQKSCEGNLISKKGWSFKYLEDYEKENNLEPRFAIK